MLRNALARFAYEFSPDEFSSVQFSSVQISSVEYSSVGGPLEVDVRRRVWPTLARQFIIGQ